MRHQVLIVGGGPAGLMAGIALARNDISVLLVDKRGLPADKVCGEGIMPPGLAVLRDLGVEEYMTPDAGAPFHGIRYVGAGGGDARGLFAEGPGLGLSRRELAAALLRRARSLNNLEIRENTPCEITVLPEGIEARVGNETMQPLLVVGADGLNSPTRIAAGLDGGPGGFRRWGARRHYGIRPWNDVVEVYSRPGIEAYITPTGPDEVGAAFLWDKKRFRPRKGGAELFSSLLLEFPVLAEKLMNAPVKNPGGAVGPLHRPARGQVAPGLVLVGDAAGYLDAITGEGLTLAAEQALALEKILVPFPREASSAVNARVSREYQAEYNRITRNYFIVTRLMLVLTRFPGFFERVISALRARPGFFAHMLSVNMGTKDLFALKPSLALKFTGSLLRRLVQAKST